MIENRSQLKSNLAPMLVAMLIPIITGCSPHESSADRAQPAPPQIKLPPTAEKIAGPHLSRAKQETERAIEEHLEDINALFHESKLNTRAFAGEALSWGSKDSRQIDLPKT